MIKQPFPLAVLILLMTVLAACTGAPTPVAPTEVPPTVSPAPPLGIFPTPTASSPAPTAAPATATAAATATVAATATATVASPTVLPTTAPFTGTQIAVQAPDNSIRLITPGGTSSILYSAGSPVDLLSVFPPANVVSGTLYLPVTGPQAGLMRVGLSGAQKLDWIKTPVYGIAVIPTRLAWGTADLSAKPASAQIQLSAPDGSGIKTALKETYPSAPRVLRVMRWSQKGTRLYFGKEPVGIGGYILFSGLTNLWSLDPATGKATEMLHERAPDAAVCIDDLSPNDRWVADHCKVKSMEVTDLTNRSVKSIAAPANVTQFGSVGGARFSPDSARLAYALARQDPNNEQGWVALADVARGTSTLISTSPAKDYFSVASWLDAKTLVLQSYGVMPGIWTVNTDGSNLKRLGDGTFVGLVAGAASTQANCGQIRMLGSNPPIDRAALDAENCFFQAYQDCRVAELTVTMAGVDAGTMHRFSIAKSGSQCRLTDTVSRYVVPRPTPAPEVLTCRGLIRRDGGLVVQGCGTVGDVVVPAPQ